jgi:hypothetical protein
MENDFGLLKPPCLSGRFLLFSLLSSIIVLACSLVLLFVLAIIFSLPLCPETSTVKSPLTNVWQDNLSDVM